MDRAIVCHDAGTGNFTTEAERGEAATKYELRILAKEQDFYPLWCGGHEGKRDKGR